MIEKVLIEAAKKAVKAWKRSDENADDLVNDLWVWYLSSPSIKVKMESIKEYEAVSLAKRAAIQILSKKYWTVIYLTDAICILSITLKRL